MLCGYIWKVKNIIFFANKYNSRIDKSNEQDSTDPISSDSVNVLEDWVRRLEDDADSDWMLVDPPLANTVLVGPANDDAEDLGTGKLSSFLIV